MDNKIAPRLPLQPQPRDNRPGGGAGSAAATGADAARSGADSVQLTDSARALQRTEQARADGAPVDAARVERLRRAVADGNYQVDATRIAGKLLALEQQVGGKS
ncbi:flagellar biosynthesis anti-sigma factor FlgM [Mizugakiibacter sediminis]|uniref:Negative regulator of flagellin synthesis n=1 Tax=Mizugakiibacter sediminis TaxID=1475481 RepID=A0A0K8QKP4_9GAMM|nr:flagellar biosynthesis anti-sigma factor FlgM [Mizugakiibacter sediminis]GAP65236.1 flagellar biosynthesis anti-sigma factor FlgM [Mizugakiibacter sediminis]